MIKKVKTIATHNGEFHTDDIFAVALLTLLFTEAQVLRTRDPRILKKCDIVVDVGGEYNPESNRFDHHQKGYYEKHINGALRCGFGLVWKHYGRKFAESEYVYKKIDDGLVCTIDALDNGQDIVKDYNIETRIHTVSDYFENFNPMEHDVELNVYDEYFLKAVEDAKRYLNRLKVKYLKEEQDAIKFEKLYKNSSNSKILVLEENISFAKHAYGFTDLIYVVFPRKEENWGILAVSESDIKPFNTKKPFPIPWRGLVNEELELSSGINGAIFCHANGFFAVVKTKNEAIKLANKALSF